MAGSISEFKSSFRGDLARANRFDVNIPVPVSLIRYVSQARRLNYRCEVAQLPGRSLSTAEQKFGSNPTEKHPYQTTYNDIDLTFIVDSDMSQKNFMDTWLDYINPSYNYNFKYKEDYTTTITINQYDVSNELTYSINLFEAFPISMNQLDLDWSNDGYHKLVVTFAYTSWKNNSMQSLVNQILDAGTGSVLNSLGGTVNVVGTADKGIATVIDALPKSANNIEY